MNALQLQKLDRLKARLKQKTTPIEVRGEMIINGTVHEFYGAKEIFNLDSPVELRRVLNLHNDFRVKLFFSRK